MTDFQQRSATPQVFIGVVLWGQPLRSSAPSPLRAGSKSLIGSSLCGFTSGRCILFTWAQPWWTLSLIELKESMQLFIFRSRIENGNVRVWLNLGLIRKCRTWRDGSAVEGLLLLFQRPSVVSSTYTGIKLSSKRKFRLKYVGKPWIYGAQVFLVMYWDVVACCNPLTWNSLCSPVWPPTHSHSPAPAFWVLGL